MPLYAYRCPGCSDFEARLPMNQVPASLPCPGCGEPSPRRFTAAHLSRASSGAYQLIESTQRSAAEPAVVRSPDGPSNRTRNSNITANPLHRKLPRPD